jgi:hypothetical protein
MSSPPLADPSERRTEEAIAWALGLALFFVVSVWAIAFSDSQQFNDAQDASFPWYLAAEAVACVAVGVIVRHPAVVALAFVPVIIAIPFGIPNDPDLREPWPDWFAWLISVPAVFVSLGAGVAIGRFASSTLRPMIIGLLVTAAVLSVALSYATQMADSTPDQQRNVSSPLENQIKGKAFPGLGPVVGAKCVYSAGRWRCTVLTQDGRRLQCFVTLVAGKVQGLSCLRRSS